MSSPAIRALPPRPDLEFERKQAKRLLRDAKHGDADALSRIREFQRGEIKLADAQLTIAREYGFRSWPLLVRYFETLDRHQRSRIHRNLSSGRKFYEIWPATLIAENRERRYWAAALIGSFAPRFYGAGIEEIFGAAVTEDEARLVVAREYGCGSWDELMTMADAEDVDPWRHATDPEYRKTLSRSETLEEKLLGRMGMHMAPARVEALLAQGADPSWVAPNGYTVLEHAIYRYWSGDAVDLIAKRVIPPDTPFVAAGTGDVSRLRRFFDRSGKLTSKARLLRPDFMALAGHVDEVMPDPGYERLLWDLAFPAALNARAAAFDFMLDRGFPIDYCPGQTLLAFAVGNGLLPMVELLISRGASPDVRGWRPEQTPREMCVGYLGRRLNEPEARRIAMLLGWDPDVLQREHDARRGPPTPIPGLRRALAFAMQDASRRGEPRVGLENFLVGIISAPHGGNELICLQQGGVDLARLRERYRSRIAETSANTNELPYDDALQAAMNAAAEYAVEQRDGVYTTVVLQHAVESEPLAGIIRELGGDVQRVKDAFRRLHP